MSTVDVALLCPYYRKESHMNRDTTTGPVFFGRWQRPAALINAGLVPPDPFPVEKLLFCAGCGQQFIGTHRTSGGDLPDGTGVADCDHFPDTGHISDCVHFPHCADQSAEDPRVYGTFCDCRPGPLPAFAVELRVHTEAHLHAFDAHESIPGITKAHYTVLALRFFTRVEIGPTADHMTFTNRI